MTKPQPQDLKGFIDGTIVALDHRIGINEDKMLDWMTSEKNGMIAVTFSYVEYYTAKDEEPHYAYEVLYLDGSESMSKIVRDIEDILERIEAYEITTKSRMEILADSYDG